MGSLARERARVLIQRCLWREMPFDWFDRKSASNSIGDDANHLMLILVIWFLMIQSMEVGLLGRLGLNVRRLAIRTSADAGLRNALDCAPIPRPSTVDAPVRVPTSRRAIAPPSVQVCWRFSYLFLLVLLSVVTVARVTSWVKTLIYGVRMSHAYVNAVRDSISDWLICCCR